MSADEQKLHKLEQAACLRRYRCLLCDAALGGLALGTE